MSKVIWSANSGELRPFHVHAVGIFMGAFRTRRAAIRRAKRLLWREGWARVTVTDVRTSSDSGAS